MPTSINPLIGNDNEITSNKQEDVSSDTSIEINNVGQIDINELPIKLEEYLRLKSFLKDLRRDFKDIIDQDDDMQKANDMQKELKKLREKIYDKNDIAEIKLQISATQEKMKLLKEIIKAYLELLPDEQATRDGIKFQLIRVLKEGKEE